MTVFIGVVSQKGGVGKSTIARLIAREHAAAGWEVKIADLDVSQGSNVEWKLRRERAGIAPVIAVEPFATVGQAVKHAAAFDLILFDGPPHSTSGTLAIARQSDFIILPTGLSQDDLRPTVLLAHGLVDAGIDADKLAFALCRVGDRENEIDEARAYIGRAGYATLTGELPEKTAFRRGSDEGRAPTEVAYASLRRRAEILAQSIVDAVNRQPQKVA